MNAKIHQKGDYRHIEGVASAAFSPGHVVELLSTGKYQKHSTAAGFAERLIVQEDALQGLTVDDAYSAGDMATIHALVPGAISLIMLKAGTNYTVGMKLISNGDGTLKQTAATPPDTFGVVEKALDLSASGAVAALGSVRVL